MMPSGWMPWRFRALLVAPADGYYSFWVAGDDYASLRLSDGEGAGGLTEIAAVPGWSRPNQWDKYPEQRSAEIWLEAGRAYRIEAIGKEAYGGDSLSVAWSGPGLERQVITADYLAPIPDPVDADVMITAIKRNIAYLHERLLGERLALDHPEIERTYALFMAVYENDEPEPTGLEVYCESRNGSEPVRRAWNAVLAYLMTDYRFLHE